MKNDERRDSRRSATDLTRRDFLQGAALGIGATLAPLGLGGCDLTSGAGGRVAAQDLPGYYPPALTGLRGSHVGAFEAAHALRDGTPQPVPVDTGEVYDLIVVGGGISGLSAAYFYRERNPSARVLVLDNHDDFGGHAKRNEFMLDGTLQLMNGGTYSIESPRPYSAVASGLLERLGIHAEELAKRIQKPDFYDSLGLVPGVFLDRETFGADFMVRHADGAKWADSLAHSPLPEKARRQIVELEEAPRDYLPHLTPAAKKQYLVTISYREYLLKVVGAEPIVAQYYQQRTHGLWGVGIEAVSALEGWATGLPGFGGLSLPAGSTPEMGETAAGFADTGGSVDVHLPDGGATIARALVRALVPAALPGTSIDDLVTARANYAALDRSGAPVRIRLSATVVHVANSGAAGVALDYHRGARAYTVRGRHAVLACWNMMIPYICPELPEPQKAALHALVKTPLIYANVAVRNWQAAKALGVGGIHCPTGYFCDINLNEYQHIGAYATPTSPDQPTVLRLQRTPCAPGLPEHEQNRIGRAEILATSFERYEHEIRTQLARTLGPGGFDHERDIIAITVNRWPHGYAPEFNPLFEKVLPEAEQAHVIGRARRGAIAIANSDAGAKAYMDAAIEQADRAVTELIGPSATATGAAS